MAEREVEKWPVVGDQFHGGGQAALNDGQVAYGQVTVQIVDVGVQLDAIAGRQQPQGRCGARPRRSCAVRGRLAGPRERVDDPPQQLPPTLEPPTVTMQTLSLRA